MNSKLIILMICGALNLVLGTLSANSNNSSGGRDRRQQCILPTLANGMTRLRQRGKLAKFQCYKTYKLIGNVYAGCSGGKWDTPIPVCAKAGCSNLLPPENGFIMLEHEGATALLFCKEGYQLAGGRQTYCNGVKWDRPLGSCRETHTTSQHVCDFEVEDLCGWTHDDTDDFEWNRVLGYESGSRRLRTGPQYDHTAMKSYAGHYMLIESFNHLPEDKARLISPVYASKLSKDTCFKFFYHMYGATVGDLRVYIKPLSVDMNTITQERKYLFFEVSGNQGNKWREGTIFLEKVNEDFQIVIEGSAGTSHLSDIAVDDVALLDENKCLGDTPKTTITETEESGGIFDIQSCENRCGETFSISQQPDRYESITNGVVQDGFIKTCDCHNGCEDLMTCCPDYRSICAFGSTYFVTEDNPTEIQQLKTTVPTSSTLRTRVTMKPTSITTTEEIRTKIKNVVVPKSTSILVLNTTIKPKTTKVIFFRDVELNYTNSPSAQFSTTTATVSTFNNTTPKSGSMTHWVKTIIPTTIDFLPSQKPLHYSEVQQDDPEFIATAVVKHHEWKTTKQISDNYFPVWIVALISIILAAGLITIIIFVVNYYRVKYGPENYKNNKEKYSNHNEIYSDVLYLTSDEQLDFTIQKVGQND